MSETTRQEEMSTVKTRLLAFLRDKHLSQSDFCKQLRVAPTYIGVMRRSMSPEKVRRLMELYPDLNREWLLYGEGEMYIVDEAQKVRRVLDDAGYLAPIVPGNSLHDNIDDWQGALNRKQSDMVVSPVQGADFAIRISGDSMEPRFRNGSVVLAKKLEDQNLIPWGNPMVIDTKNGVFVKEIYPSSKGDSHIEARSSNPSYPPVEIPVDSIYGCYRILANVATFTSF